MGSQTILDIIGSTMVFGSLMLMAIRMNVFNSENMQAFRGDVVVQQNMVELVGLLEYDFRKIGYCKDPSKMEDPTKFIIYADDDSIEFQTDYNNDGNVDTMIYAVGPTGEASNTPNPRDRLLYRYIKGGSRIGVNMGVTLFHLTYYNNTTKDSIQTPVTGANTGTIGSMQIDVKVENYSATSVSQYAGKMDSLNNSFQSAYWRQVRMVAKNLNNR